MIFQIGVDVTVKALVIGDHYIPASVIADSLKETLRKIQISLEVKTIDLDFPFKIRLPSREKKLTIYDIQGDPEDIIPYMGDVEILVAHFAEINARVINAGKKLKVIGVPRG